MIDHIYIGISGNVQKGPCDATCLVNGMVLEAVIPIHAEQALGRLVSIVPQGSTSVGHTSAASGKREGLGSRLGKINMIKLRVKGEGSSGYRIRFGKGLN